MKNVYLMVLLFVVASFSANCQDTLRLMNGSEINVKIEVISEGSISFQPLNSKKTSFQVRTTDEIFSFKKEGQPEVQLYKYNPEIGNFYQISEMKQYMVGERHVELYHNTRWTKISALAAGAVAGYFVANGGGIVTASPIFFASVMTLPKAHIQKNKDNVSIHNEFPYKDGYTRVAKGKRFLNNLAYSALGMIGSFVIFELADSGN
ncbi:MAG: hypothetical protein ACJARP_000396 [Vicingaceae bacterium]|jgi:hypothetical protein